MAADVIVSEKLLISISKAMNVFYRIAKYKYFFKGSNSQKFNLDDDSVKLTVIGGVWSDESGVDYSVQNAFDKNVHNTYHSNACAKKNPRKGFIWEFGRTIELQEISIVTRKGCCSDRYNKVCVYADNTKIGCTPDKDFEAGDMINMIKDHRFIATNPAIEGKVIKLYFEDNEEMAVNELYLNFKEKGK